MAVGCMWAARGLFAAYAPGVFLLFLLVTSVAQAVACILFSLDVCADCGSTIRNVATVNYAVFMLAAAAGFVLYGLSHDLLASIDADAWVSFAAIASLFGVVPLLPSRGSRAVTFTLSKLPEEEGYDERVSANRAMLAERYSLSQREEEVLTLLLEGKGREEIAELLDVSPWTVKSHVSNLYKKAGVHSLRELTVMVAGERKDSGL